jgi:HAD superfamily hydrolase (TIGR01548 family)
MNRLRDFSAIPAQQLSRKKTKDKKVELIIFDVDGVLVDVRGSFHLTTLQTVKFFTGQRVTSGELQQWKSRSGFNDDWRLSTAWVQSLGGRFEYEEVKHKFMELYWGKDGRGNVRREKWLLPKASLRRLSKVAELAIFTGRTRRELDHTLKSLRVRQFFGNIITVDDVAHPKPDPEGLLKILKGRPAESALYVGDSVDDAIASQLARIPFVGVSFGRGRVRKDRIRLLKDRGAKAVVDKVTDLEPWLNRAATAATVIG